MPVPHISIAMPIGTGSPGIFCCTTSREDLRLRVPPPPFPPTIIPLFPFSCIIITFSVEANMPCPFDEVLVGLFSLFDLDVEVVPVICTGTICECTGVGLRVILCKLSGSSEMRCKLLIELGGGVCGPRLSSASELKSEPEKLGVEDTVLDTLDHAWTTRGSILLVGVDGTEVVTVGRATGTIAGGV